MMRSRRGFTLVELLVVAVVGILLVLATYQVLIVNQRTYTVQNAQVRAQQSTRAAMDVLFNELREVSSRDGDILSVSADELTARVMRAYGVICDPAWTTTAEFRVRPAGSSTFVVGDSVVVFADNNEASRDDDVWVRARVSGVDDTVACTNGDAAVDVTLAGHEGDFTAQVVQMGAPMRAIGTLTYGLYVLDGETYLGRQEPGGDWVPIVGPLAPATAAAPGLELAYFDQNGVATAVPANIREIRVTLRAVSEAKDFRGGLVSDSITASIYTRN
jgi:type II secretory pathway pseudopilin PulG